MMESVTGFDKTAGIGSQDQYTNEGYALSFAHNWER